jgi:beta-lactam-binding protein with PASTA domain
VVLAQSASAGSVLGVGTPIDLVISLGPRRRPRSCPTWSGSTRTTRARSRSSRASGTDALVVERVEASEAAPGTVVSQSLAPYRRVPLDGAVLRLLVAEGQPGRDAEPRASRTCRA